MRIEKNPQLCNTIRRNGDYFYGMHAAIVQQSFKTAHVHKNMTDNAYHHSDAVFLFLFHYDDRSMITFEMKNISKTTVYQPKHISSGLCFNHPQPFPFSSMQFPLKQYHSRKSNKIYITLIESLIIKLK